MACLRATLRESATIGVEQNKPMSTPGVANFAVGGGDCQIAARHQLTTGGGRHALHGGNHWLRQIDDLLHHRAAHGHDVLEIVSATIGIASPAGEFLEIVTRAEGRAICGKHHGARRSCRRQFRSKRWTRRDQQGFRQAVAGFGRLSTRMATSLSRSRSSTGASAVSVVVGAFIRSVPRSQFRRTLIRS